MKLNRLDKYIIKKTGSLELFEKLTATEQSKILAPYWKKYKVVA